MDISIIIVSWKVRDKLRDNLTALFASETRAKFEVWVVDNDSRDGTAEMVAREFPDVRLMANSENAGFARANNQAIRAASGRYVLLLNPDMRVYPDTLEKMLAFAAVNPRATVCGCRLVDEQGQTVPQVRRFPTFYDQLMVTLKIPHLWPRSIAAYRQTGFNYEQAAPVDSLRGAFFLINRMEYARLSGQERPLLDERYFIWFEEVDFCREIYRLGGEVWYTPAARCLDYVGASFKQVARHQGQAYFRDSMLKYFRKWESPWQARVLSLAWRAVSLFV